MNEICKFTFQDGIDQEFIEEKIATAIITAECVYGQAKVRLHAAYSVSNNKVVIDISSDVGEHIAQVFTGLVTKELGELQFTVDRIRRKD